MMAKKQKSSKPHGFEDFALMSMAQSYIFLRWSVDLPDEDLSSFVSEFRDLSESRSLSEDTF